MNRPYSTRLRRGIIAILILYWLALVTGTHWPKLPQIGPSGFDKVLHVSAYAGLIVLLSLSVFWGRPASWRQYGLIWLGLALFGGFDELTQPPFHRTADWYDWFADLTGLALGLLVALVLNFGVRRWLLPQADAKQNPRAGQ
jgi:VanZ family protein